MSESNTEEDKKTIEVTSEDERKNKIQALVDGFKLHRINLKDHEDKDILWSCKDDFTKFKDEFKVEFTKDVYEQSQVILEIVFSSIEPMDHFSLKHQLIFKTKCLEEWSFDYGPISEKSKHTWQIVLTSSPDVTNMPLDALSGNLILETKYFDKDIHFHTTFIRVFYEGIS